LRAVAALIIFDLQIMIKRQDLERTYAAYSNYELLQVVEYPERYTPLALEVAQQELKKRNITESEKEEFKESEKKEALLLIDKYFLLGLTVWQKLFFYLLWIIPFLHLPFKQNLAQDGYILKSRQSSYYSICGFLMLLIALLVSFTLGIESEWIIWVMWPLLFFIPLRFDTYFNQEPLIKKFNKEIARAKNLPEADYLVK
jgi:hypothetical protein